MATLNLRAFRDDLHDTLRVEAAKRKMSMKALVEEAVTEWLKEAGKAGRRPA